MGWAGIPCRLMTSRFFFTAAMTPIFTRIWLFFPESVGRGGLKKREQRTGRSHPAIPVLYSRRDYRSACGAAATCFWTRFKHDRPDCRCVDLRTITACTVVSYQVDAQVATTTQADASQPASGACPAVAVGSSTADWTLRWDSKAGRSVLGSRLALLTGH